MGEMVCCMYIPARSIWCLGGVCWKTVSSSLYLYKVNNNVTYSLALLAKILMFTFQTRDMFFVL